MNFVEPLIAFILPLLFIASMISLIYSISLYISSKHHNSDNLRRKSFRLGIISLLTIVSCLTFIQFSRTKNDKQLILKLSGTYIYTIEKMPAPTDSSYQLLSKFILHNDKSFVFDNRYNNNTYVRGTWKVFPDYNSIELYDSTKKLLWRPSYKEVSGRIVLAIKDENSKIVNFTRK